VQCDGKRLEEWAPTHREHRQECWIASEEGKNFEVFVECSSVVVQNFSLDLYIDGVCTTKDALMSRKDRSCRMRDAIVSETEQKPSDNYLDLTSLVWVL